MRIAFDYGGVLQTHEWTREIAKALLSAGHQVYCITACPDHLIEQRAREVADLGIHFTDVFITHNDTVDGSDNILTAEMAFEAGLEKAEVMQEIDCEILIDDIPQIIIAVRQAGFIGLHLA